VGPADAQPTPWFEPLADHLGAAYLRYSFTKGTANEVAFLVDQLGLEPGMRVLDVGCGPGRHAHALAGQGLTVVGVDVAQRFVDLATEHAPAGASFVRADARDLTFHEEFDAAISLCQGAFGLTRDRSTGSDRLPAGPDPDEQILSSIHRALVPGGHLALSAFSAYFQVRFLEDADTFDAATGLNHERTRLRSEAGAELEADLWTTCYTPRELRMLADRAGFEPIAIHSVTPGRYAPNPPDLDQPELLLIARRT
jgi:SAM-dependent methyltransferase